MPAIVDHEARREKVAAIATRLVAEHGAEGLTFRAVAKEAGCSTAIVSHYFADKKALMLYCYNYSAARSRRRFDKVEEQGGTILDWLETIAPLDRERRDDWRVWFAFWGAAIADRVFARNQRDQVDMTRKRLGEFMATKRETSGRSRDEREELAERLIVMAMGLAVAASFDPKDWPAERQRSMIMGELRDMGLTG